MARMREQVPTLQAGVTAAIVAAVLGSAVNDSGAIVGGVTLLVLTAGLAWLALDVAAPVAAPAGEVEAEVAPPATAPPTDVDVGADAAAAGAAGTTPSTASPARAGADLP
jgi:hypothetical protein